MIAIKIKKPPIIVLLVGISLIPNNNTIIGGFLIFMSIVYYSLVIKTNRRFIALN